MADSEPTRPRRGMAIFAVLSLVVIFTVLGIGAITLAQRDNASSGSILDIKSKESAAYAGLVYSLGEFQRNPANFVALLQAWQTKSVYGGSPQPLWLDFSSSPVALTKTQPSPFTPPGSTAKIVVQLDGIFVPPDAATLPVITLKSTGTGRSGDAQTVIGAYQIQNIVFNTPSATLPISHAFYLNGNGMFNNKIVADGGDVYLGGDVNINSATTQIAITKGGLHL